MNKPKSEDGGRQTEDEIARASLGGTKGSSDLKPAPLTKQEDEDIILDVGGKRIANAGDMRQALTDTKAKASMTS